MKTWDIVTTIGIGLGAAVIVAAWLLHGTVLPPMWLAFLYGIDSATFKFSTGGKRSVKQTASVEPFWRDEP